jgi:hypothetical protein
MLFDGMNIATEIDPRFTVSNYFAEHAGRFVHENIASVLLAMPGCQSLFVNPTHERSFPQAAPTNWVVRSESDVVGNIHRVTSAESDPGATCYCYPMRSVVALNAQHCVFERSLKRTVENGGSSVDVAAFLQNQNGSRTYDLYLTKTTLLRAGDKKFLNAEFYQFSGISVTVSRVSENGMDFIQGETKLNGAPLLDRQRWPMGGEDGHGYAKVSETITKVVDSMEEAKSNPAAYPCALSDSRSQLEETVRSCLDLDYEAAAGFLNGIYALCANDSTQKVDVIQRELQSINERLFDAYVVMDKIVWELRKRIVGVSQDGKS